MEDHGIEELKRHIRELLAARTDKRPLKTEELLKALALPATDRKRLRRLLREMASEGTLEKSHGQKFAATGGSPRVIGTLRLSARGFGFVVPDDAPGVGGKAESIFIPPRNVGDAMNRDKVVVRTGQTDRNPEGMILEVLERGTKEVVGVYHSTKRGGTVIPRDERFGRTISTPRPNPALEIDDGDFVIVEITAWPPGDQPLLGRVREALGNADTKGIDITVIIRDAGIEPKFPANVIAETESFASGISEEEISGRTDFRQTATFTMDGATAKDFDDALSIEALKEGGWRLGVHIADVSHYVRESSLLDIEAYDRATSIYPVDRVVPMLPEKLSNDLCSLRPNEDRLVMSCVMDVDTKGKVHGYSIHEGIIRSKHRLVYEDVQAVMDGTAPPAKARETGDIRLQLEQLYELRKVLTAMRMRRGALDLDIPEVEVLFHEDESVKGLERRPRLESHRVVEECMLLANEVVASHLFNLAVPSIYRIHEKPDLNKLRQIQPALAQLGVRFPAKHDITHASIQSALDMAARQESGFIARRLILRSMMRAQYSDEDRGHFGLASSCYTHFTSPIRRYPDLLIHRLLRETLAHGAKASGIYSPPAPIVLDDDVFKPPRKHSDALPGERLAYWRNNLHRQAKHCSAREQRAEDIEYAAVKLKTLEYMRTLLGEEYDGLITSVVNWGFFVELKEIPVEGLVHVRNLKDDYFEYDAERMTLSGRETGKTFKLGDAVRIRLEAVNLATLEMDFVLVAAGTPGERLAQIHRQRRERDQRHGERRPRQGGFQARGKRRGRR